MERVIILDQLAQLELSQLFEDKRAVLIVRRFSASDVCKQIATRLLNLREAEPYLHEIIEGQTIRYEYLGVDRVGYPFNLTLKKDASIEDKQRYYSEALDGTHSLRRLAEPMLSPIDKLRLVLDEIWPDGSNIATFEGRKMLAGIARLMRAELSAASEETLHVDILPNRVFDLDNQFAANIFIQMPDLGGELFLWDIPPYRHADENNPKPLSKDQLPDPLIISPKTGDLILFCSRKPHAIAGFPSGQRISLQCFIGTKHRTPLFLWN